MTQKTLLCNVRFLIFLTGLVIGSASAAQSAELLVHVKNPPSEGTFIFYMFDDANKFGDLRDPFEKFRFPSDGRKIYRIHNIPAGEYALMLHYDENENGVLDRNFIGIPVEQIAFSNRYMPKGPPGFNRASFRVAEAESRFFELELFRPLGTRGRPGIGIGVIGKSSPYRDYDGAVYQVIPAVTYNGERLQILGTNLRFGLAGSDRLRLALTARYRIGVYEEDDSPFLNGLGDRNDTLMAGLALIYEFSGGIDLRLGYDHDVLDRIGGGAAHAELDKSFQSGIFRLSPNVSLNWLSSDLSNHDFGVPGDKATPDREAYSLDDIFIVEAGVRTFVELTRDWRILLNVSVEFLGDEITESPIVSENYAINGFTALNYVF